MRRITITNRSAWPDWFVRPLVEWVADRAGITWDYAITLKSAVRPEYWRGMNYGRCACNLTCHRRNTRAKHKDHRFKWSPTYDLKPGIEMLVYLMAHEMFHSTGGHPRHFLLPGGRTNRDLMEFKCNEFGAAAAKAFWEWWPGQRVRAMAKMRRARQRQAVAADRSERRDQERAAPDARIAKAEAMAVAWERKARLATNRAKKWRRRAGAIRAAAHRRRIG